MSELLKINVNDHIEKKNGLSYLSWAWAWAEVLKIDPLATWEVAGLNNQPVMFLPDGSALVNVQVTIKGHTKGCLLPVMNHRNQAIKNPDAFAINTALMRCLAKAIAMHGLGLYIYAGEDLPEDAGKPAKDQMGMDSLDPESERAAELRELALYLIDAYANGNELDAIGMFYGAETWSKDQPTATEEQKYVWGLLRTESKLRAMLKANSPHAKKETA